MLDITEAEPLHVDHTAVFDDRERETRNAILFALLLNRLFDGGEACRPVRRGALGCGFGFLCL